MSFRGLSKPENCDCDCKLKLRLQTLSLAKSLRRKVEIENRVEKREKRKVEYY